MTLSIPDMLLLNVLLLQFAASLASGAPEKR
jgi:hypothetical protein